MKTKTHICIHCHHEFEGSIFLGRDKQICPSCKEKGIKPITSKASIIKRKQTCLEKYGVENPSQIIDVVNKRKQTCLEKYGVENPSQLPQIKEKIRKNNLKKYGVESINQIESIKKKKQITSFQNYGTENPSQSQVIQEKIKNTNQQRYGKDHYFQCEEFRKKQLMTNFTKYGVSHHMKNPTLRERASLTCLKNNGVPFPMMSSKIQQKSKETLHQNFGVDAPIQSPIIKEKIKETNKKRFGHEWGLQTKEIQTKIKETNRQKYGVENVNQSPIVQEKIQKTKKENFIPLLKTMLENFNLEMLDEYINEKNMSKFKCLNCGHVFESCWNYVQQGYLCPVCYPKENGISKLENEIVEFIESLNLKIVKNSKKIIPPKELDIYIPEKKVAIEFNGLYWHSEQMGCDKNYHIFKTNACLKQNIQLIHVFEDEWLFRREIVESRLKQILGVNDAIRIHARKCFIKEISPQDKDIFLEKYHIQGKDNSKIRLGAFHGEELVAVMTFSHGNISKGSKKKTDIWELNRFCTKIGYHIPGIASKMMNHFQRNYKWKEIFSYADRRWSVGNVYAKLGFEFESITQPNYWYVKNMTRYHRFSLRKSVDNPDHLPEKEIRQKQGYFKIWDCGNLKFVLENNNYQSFLTF